MTALLLADKRAEVPSERPDLLQINSVLGLVFAEKGAAADPTLVACVRRFETICSLALSASDALVGSQL